MNAKRYRRKAQRALKGKWGRMAALMLLAYAVLAALAGIFTFAAMGPLMVSAFQGLDRMAYGAEAATRELMQIPASFFVVLVIGSAVILAAESLLLVGLSGAACALLRGEKPKPRHLFPMRSFGKAVAMYWLRILLVEAQMLLLVVPGVIAAFRYAMADYLLAAHPDMGPVEALRESRRRMKGRKLKLFYLLLSFVGWALAFALPTFALQIWGRNAIGLTFAIEIFCAAGQVFLGVYMLTAVTAFFRRADSSGKKKTRPRES